MNPFVCASLAFLLTVSQAVAVTAKAKSGSKSKGKKSIPLIVGVVVAAVVVLIVVALIVLIKMRSRKLKRMSVPVKPQDVSYINGGPTTDPGKAGYLPHTPTLPTAPQSSAEWRQDPPQPQFTPVPSFPTPHVPYRA